MNMRFYIYSCTLICMKRSEAIDQLREMDAKYSCYVYCKNELAVVLGEQGQKLNRTLSSLVSAKALVRAARGVYVFAYSSHLGVGHFIRSQSGCVPASWCGKASKALCRAGT